MRSLSIVGVGTEPKKHLTIEALEAIQGGLTVFLLGIQAKELPEGALSERHTIYDLMEFYKDGGTDNDHYYRIAEFVLDNLSDEGNNTLLVPGDPRVGVDVTQILENISGEFSLDTICLPGVSSATTMLHDIGLDLLAYGTCYLDVNRILENGISINPNITNVIYHVCSIGTRQIHFTNPSRFNKVDLLSTHLSDYFSPTHPCLLVRSAESSECPRSIREGTISEITNLLEDVDFSSTLVIPARNA